MEIQYERPLMPIAGGTVNSEPFSVPKGAKSMAIHCPGLASNSTLAIQSLAPKLDDQESDVWDSVFVFNLADGSTVHLDGIPEEQVTVIPTSATGGGRLRFVAADDQSGTPVRIPVAFNFD
jgi:hypothetical protein